MRAQVNAKKVAPGGRGSESVPRDISCVLSRDRRKRSRRFLVWLCTGAMLYGQPPTVNRPSSPVWWRPYMPTTISPARMTNTQRIHSLMRAGRLYLT